MSLGGHGRLLDLGEQAVERQLPIDIGAEHLGVDEKADQALGFDPVAVGHRHADTDLRLAAVAVQQGLERGQQHHEQAGLRAGPVA